MKKRRGRVNWARRFALVERLDHDEKPLPNGVLGFEPEFV